MSEQRDAGRPVRPDTRPAAWVAGANGLAHQQVAGALRASCGAPWLAARWAWPEVRRCAECQLAGGLLPLGGAERGASA